MIHSYIFIFMPFIGRNEEQLRQSEWFRTLTTNKLQTEPICLSRPYELYKSTAGFHSKAYTPARSHYPIQDYQYIHINYILTAYRSKTHQRKTIFQLSFLFCDLLNIDTVSTSSSGILLKHVNAVCLLQLIISTLPSR